MSNLTNVRAPLFNVDFKNRGKVRHQVRRGGDQSRDVQAADDYTLLLEFRRRVAVNIESRGGAGGRRRSPVVSFIRLAKRQAL